MTELSTLDEAAVGELLADDDALRSWLPEVLSGGQVTGTVRFALSRPGRPALEQLVRFTDGRVEVLDGGVPDVTIAMSAADCVRLVAGQASAPLLYLADELSLEGDELLALDVAAVLSGPGAQGALVDPTALDPVDVSRAIKDVSTAHLDDVMGSALRELVVSEVFRRLPDFLIERKARNADLAVGFRIEGANGLPADRFLVEVRQGACAVTRDPAEDARRDVTLLLDGPSFLRLVLGHTNPVRAVMSGRLKLKGDPAKALAFNAVMRIPKP